MNNLLGEYDCKVDAKGRFMFPAQLKKQLGDVAKQGFVVNRNLHEKCLFLYPVSEWNKLTKKLGKLNRLIKRNDKVVRLVMSGATPVDFDSSGRMLLPKALGDYAMLDKDIKVVGTGTLIELWDAKNYNKYYERVNSEEDIEKLMEESLGDMDFGDEE
jgi:MraZ protein